MTNERQARIETVLSKRQSGLTVVLENVSDPHNISAIMRTCDAVGIQDLYILNTTIELHEKWGAKSSSSAVNWLTIHQFTNTAECFSALKQKFDKIFTTHLGAESIDLYEIDFTQKIALVFGNEHSGCSKEVIDLSDGNFIIPQVGIIKSLNISVACAVSIYEAYRQKSNAAHYENMQLDENTANRLRSKWSISKSEKRQAKKLNTL